MFTSDGGRVPVVYPRLRTLSMAHGELYSMKAMGLLPDVAFMPQLRRLRLGAPPEVSLVALLRGSWGTLESLEVNYTREAVGRMEELCAAFSNMPSNLRHISMLEIFDYPSYEANTEEVARCAFSMCPTIESVTIAGASEPDENVWKYALDGLSLVNLTRLNAPWSTLDMTGVVTILRAAPNLQAIACRTVEVGGRFDKYDDAALPAHMHKNYYPLGKCFTEIDVWCTDSVSRDISRTALLLGVMCPVFTFLNVEREYVEKCRTMMQAKASTSPYKAFQPMVDTICVRERKE
ncbi:hypothetical protein H4R19_000666 [Coemansia spiralis]|nr:hypothetical protein H4R19_000666 [Coemansia spiralis]